MEKEKYEYFTVAGLMNQWRHSAKREPTQKERAYIQQAVAAFEATSDEGERAKINELMAEEVSKVAFEAMVKECREGTSIPLTISPENLAELQTRRVAAWSEYAELYQGHTNDSVDHASVVAVLARIIATYMEESPSLTKEDLRRLIKRESRKVLANARRERFRRGEYSVNVTREEYEASLQRLKANPIGLAVWLCIFAVVIFAGVRLLVYLLSR